MEDKNLYESKVIVFDEDDCSWTFMKPDCRTHKNKILVIYQHFRSGEITTNLLTPSEIAMRVPSNVVSKVVSWISKPILTIKD
jgi:hypothetical protein